MELKGKDFLTFRDFTGEEIRRLVDYAAELKALQKKGTPHKILEGKTLAMIFQKASTRTRVSFEVGIFQLGGHGVYISNQGSQLGRGEPIRDTARVLSRYCDGILIRTFGQEEVEELAEFSEVPVINGLTDEYHPTQVLADLLTIQEAKGRLEGVKLAYVGDGNNMAHSLMIAGAKLGMDIRIACPAGYGPDDEVAGYCRGLEGCSLTVTGSPEEAVSGADVLYTDVWASMGQEEEAEKRKRDFAGFCLDKRLLDLAADDAVVLHCLPAHRGEEITDEVMESAASRIFDEAENRLHAHKAVMAAIM